VTWTSWVMLNSCFAIPCTFVSCLDMYNYTNYNFMKTSSFSLVNRPNHEYMVHEVWYFFLWKS
jgi:hypothetical protein